MTEPRGAIHFIARAPLDISYQHTIDFTYELAQEAYWASLVKFSLHNYSYIRRERRYIQIEKSFDDLDDINYLYFRSSGSYGTKVYYAFVTDREYVSDTVTRVYFEIDVMQTYMFDYKFQPTFITQAHVDRWDANHKPIYSKTDEGLNYGSEYVTEAAFRIACTDKKSVGEIGALTDESKHGFYLIYCSEHSALVAEGVASEPTKIDGNVSPYVIYLIPTVEEGQHITEKVITHCMFQENFDPLSKWQSEPMSNVSGLQRLMQDSAFGKAIQHIVYVPYLPFKYAILDKDPADPTGARKLVLYNTGDITATFGRTRFNIGTIGVIDLVKIKEIRNSGRFSMCEMPRNSGLDLVIPSEKMFDDLKVAPWATPFDRRFQSKLLCYPYRFNVFTDWATSPALIKNEYMTGDTIRISGAIAFSFNIPRRFWVEGYRGDPEGRESGIMQPIPADQPITNDEYYSYMLQNKNQISANLTNAKINAIAGTIGGAVSGGMSGASAGVGGAIGGAIFGGVSAGLSGARTVQASIRSENAKQADLKNIPDTISNSNDCAFMVADGSKYLTFYRKKIACEYEDQLAQYWHMYGYKVNRLEIPNLRSRVRFNFIKTIGANIVAAGDIDATNLNLIKQIFDNGITIWHCPIEEHAGGQWYGWEKFKPLDYSYENPEVSIV